MHGGREGLRKTVLLAAAGVGPGPEAIAQPGAPPEFHDKSDFTLVHPTPRHLRRDMSTDRPDTTESPYTVDAGAVQLEMSYLDFSKNGETRSLALAPINVKIGLTNSIDVQFVLDSYAAVRERGEWEEGLGDLQLRLKFNIWGNDEGSSAFGIMPFVKIPTASSDLGNDHVEGGLILAYGRDLAAGVGLGLMLEPDIVFDEDDDDYDFEVLHTATVGFDLVERLGWFVEFAGVISDDAAYSADLNTGLTVGVTDDLVLDGGVRIGLTGDADDIGLFAGMSIRF